MKMMLCVLIRITLMRHSDEYTQHIKKMIILLNVEESNFHAPKDVEAIEVLMYSKRFYTMFSMELLSY